ncbi:hypothetical protein OURE66S_04565 [Oligella ureolytica]
MLLAIFGQYGNRYGFAIERPVMVTDIEPVTDGFKVSAGAKNWYARAVVLATGSWRNPYIPKIAGLEKFTWPTGAFSTLCISKVVCQSK